LGWSMYLCRARVTFSNLFLPREAELHITVRRAKITSLVAGWSMTVRAEVERARERQLFFLVWDCGLDFVGDPAFTPQVNCVIHKRQMSGSWEAEA